MFLQDPLQGQKPPTGAKAPYRGQSPLQGQKPPTGARVVQDPLQGMNSYRILFFGEQAPLSLERETPRGRGSEQGSLQDAQDVQDIVLWRVRPFAGHEAPPTRLAQGPVKTMGIAKKTMYEAQQMDFQDTLDMECRRQARRMTQPDFINAVTAFLAKKKPTFS